MKNLRCSLSVFILLLIIISILGCGGSGGKGNQIGTGVQTITKVAAGGFFTLALAANGKVYAWGSNDLGQLGDGSDTTRVNPVGVKLPAGATITSIAAGAFHSLALTSDGKVYAWGGNFKGELGIDPSTYYSDTPILIAGGLAGKTIVAIAAGQDHSVAVTNTGVVYTWGDNTNGQLGNGSTSTTPVYNPTSVAGLQAKAVAAGNGFTLAIDKVTSKVWGWGRNNMGQLGDGGAVNPRLSPNQINFTASHIAAGEDFTIAADSSGAPYAWGNNTVGQLGKGTSGAWVKTPNPVNLTEHTFAVAAGSFHNAVLCDHQDDSYVYTWGSNQYGQLGDGLPFTTDPHPAPIDITARITGTVDQLAAGWDFTVLVTSDGKVWTWGRNCDGQLGDGTKTDRNVPVQVKWK